MASAEPNPSLGQAMRLVLETIVGGGRADRGLAAKATRAFIDARVRGRRIPSSEAENIASDIELKLLERPELFLAADNPAAYIAISIRNRADREFEPGVEPELNVRRCRSERQRSSSAGRCGHPGLPTGAVRGAVAGSGPPKHPQPERADGASP
jgi:hypothetical protein